MTLITVFRNKKRVILMTAGILSVGVIVSLAIVLTVLLGGHRAKAAVVSNGRGCSEIGMDILQKGGNAVEAAIATLFCDGAAMPVSMGLGGGFLMTIYNRSTGGVWSLDARESAPGAATTDMYQGNPQAAQIGPLSVAVPGELIGYWYAYQRFGGSVPWSDLVLPTRRLCLKGIYVTDILAKRYESNKAAFFADPVLKEAFINPATNDTYKEGQYVKRLKLAETLKVIAEEGGNALHNGTLTEGFVKDIKDSGGIISVEDMKNYRPVWREPIKTTFSNGDTLYSSALPGSGPVLTLILNTLDGFLDLNNPYSTENFQKIVETFKFAYGWRTKLGDDTNLTDLVSNITSKTFAAEIRDKILLDRTVNDTTYYGAINAASSDHGTDHISVIAENGDAVSVTSTINSYFGAKFASNSTGIILNNEMDDFSSPNITNIYNLPPSPANFIAPGKRPLSSMVPTIILDQNKDVVLVIGAAGGSKITTSVAQIIIYHLWFGADLKTALNSGRVHHQLFPMSINVEPEFKDKYPKVVEGLKQIGHEIDINGPNDGFSAATAITNVTKTEVFGVSDRRRPGSTTYGY